MSEGSLDQRIDAAREREGWRRSPEYRVARKRTWQTIGAAAGAAIVICLAWSLTNTFGGPLPRHETVAYFVVAVIVFVVGLITSVLYFSSRREQFRDERLLERYGDLTDRQGQLLDEDQLKLGELWRLSEERLRVYHEIATRQAKASFRNAQWAIVAGFIVIVAGSLAVLSAKNITTAVVVGALGAVGAALSAYIGKTFLRLQENAASHLRSYFDQPREQFRYLAAERLLNHISDDGQKAAAINEMIRSIASISNASNT